MKFRMLTITFHVLDEQGRIRPGWGGVECEKMDDVHGVGASIERRSYPRIDNLREPFTTWSLLISFGLGGVIVEFFL